MRCYDLFYFLLLIIPKYVLDITWLQICRVLIFPFDSQSSANTTEKLQRNFDPYVSYIISINMGNNVETFDSCA